MASSKRANPKLGEVAQDGRTGAMAISSRSVANERDEVADEFPEFHGTMFVELTAISADDKHIEERRDPRQSVANARANRCSTDN